MPDTADGRAYVSDVLSPDTSELRAALDAARSSGYTAGLLTAAEQVGPGVASAIGGVAIPGSQDEWSTFWDQWTPGNAPAAELLRGGGLADLLASSDVTVKGITGTLLDGLGTRLADGVSRGLSVDEIASTLSDYVNNPVRAHMIAQTETARAVSLASKDAYTAAGIATVDWLVSPGACDVCQSYADNGPYTLQDLPEEPAHPNCRCAYAPRDPGLGTAGQSVLNQMPNISPEEAQAASEAASAVVEDSPKPYRPSWLSDEEAPPKPKAEYVDVDKVLSPNAKVFHSYAGIKAYASTGRLPVSSRLTAQAQEAIKAYSDREYMHVNAALREGRGYGDTQKIISGLDSALAKSVLKDTVRVTRMVGKDALDMSQNLEGTVFQDDGFLSTSMASSVNMNGRSSIKLILDVPKGTHAIFLDSSQYAEGESELLVNRGSKIAIKKTVQEGTSGRYTRRW